MVALDIYTGQIVWKVYKTCFAGFRRLISQPACIAMGAERCNDGSALALAVVGMDRLASI
jgi:hypothetical protein